MTPSVAEVEAFHEFLADHFIMWRDLERFCSCGLKFGFSDSAIHHVASLLASREAAARAEAWDEAVQALGWALNNGPSERALPYVAEHNPYRIARTDGAGS
jgi:hypothetical protein